MIFGRQPAFWIGLIVTIVLGVVSTLTDQGLINEAVQGKITDGVNAIAQIAMIFGPLIATLLVRPLVTPVAAPALNEGTTVTVITPGDTPNGTQVLKAA